MANRRFVIAGSGSGVGKTTLTLGLMAAFQKRGLTVQGFKCGPDYIDPSFQTALTGRPARNLDSWMFSEETLMAILARGQNGADLSIIEGVMGFYDGKDPLSNRGSTAEISLLTSSPVVLVVNCASMARSAAAIVKGFQMLDEKVDIRAVIANKVGSEGHYKLVKAAVEQECGVPVIGYLTKQSELTLPERHLGLVPAIERGDLDGFFNKLAEVVGEQIDLDMLYELSEAPAVAADETLFAVKQPIQVTIAVAKDEAFNFYYPENFELLEVYGAKLHYFSPLRGETIPQEASALYIGGGFPEEFARELAEQEAVKASIRAAAERGMPILAECGGYMYLTDSLQTTDGETHEMVGLVRGSVRMTDKLAALGYREIEPSEKHPFFSPADQLRGHEFHYSVFETDETQAEAYHVSALGKTACTGYAGRNIAAGYTHLHFASNPTAAEKFVAAAKEYGRDE
ncbi:cobyrinate a,c-diamide synthase [Bacillus tianshenii]|nr:cobyrinate a,c-diamide synthase [Bacillus tianshenii]